MGSMMGGREPHSERWMQMSKRHWGALLAAPIAVLAGCGHPLTPAAGPAGYQLQMSMVEYAQLMKTPLFVQGRYILKEANALRAKSDGEAYANLKVAQAQAEAMRVQNAALRENKDVLELRRIEVELKKAERWDGKLPEHIYAGAPVPFMNVNPGK